METTRLTTLPSDIESLASEADAVGLRFLRRLMEEWAKGTNRFDGPGELLLAARIDGRLVGICGLNSDPYSGDPGVGRVRHLYVLEDFRRRGVARHLLESVVAAARGAFRELHLRSDDEQAAQLYERFGFRRISGEAVTHALTLL